MVVSGPSGVGKTTLCERLLKKERRLKACITATTRRPRKGEIDGKDYHFVTPAEFRRMIQKGELVEYVRLFDNYYGTPEQSLADIFERNRYPLLRIDVQGARRLKAKGYKGVYIFILPPDVKILLMRLKGRSGKSAGGELLKRFRKARTELRAKDEYDFQVVNDKLPQAVRDIQNILKRHLFKDRR
ncbi:MAG: guanylate kinase [Planctomycetes bacterium]|nr:guanylate kinase [Planctomycetota bacterium]